MKKPALLLPLAIWFAISFSPAQAQGIYGQVDLTHESATSAWYHGFTGGIYANIIKIGPVRLGLDARGTYAAGDKYSYRSFLFGPRLQLKPPVLPIGPYIQGAVGVGGSKYTGPSSLSIPYDNKFQYGFIAGIDYTIFPHVDLRLPELQYLRSSAVSGGSLSPATNIFSVNAGIVFRLP